jgi:hypothetical protein
MIYTLQFRAIVQSEETLTYKITLVGKDLGWAYPEPEVGKNITIGSPREFEISPLEPEDVKTKGIY